MSQSRSNTARTAVLGVLTTGAVGFLIWDSLLAGKPAAVEVARPIVATEVAEVGSRAPEGAPQGLDRKDLLERYSGVFKTDPFKVRTFKERPKSTRTERGPSAPRGGPSAEPKPEPKPSRLELRLTATFGVGDELQAVFEQPGDGKGVFVKTGQVLGDTTIVEIQERAVVVEQPVEDAEKGDAEKGDAEKGGEGEAGPGQDAGEGAAPKTEQQTIRLNGTLDLPLSQGEALEEFKVKRVAPGTIDISDEKKQSILERLRARRRAQQAKGGGK